MSNNLKGFRCRQWRCFCIAVRAESGRPCGGGRRRMSPASPPPTRRPCLSFRAEPSLAPRGINPGARVVPVAGHVVDAHAAVVANVSLDAASADAFGTDGVATCHAAGAPGRIPSLRPNGAFQAHAPPKRTVNMLSVEGKDAVFWDNELTGFGVRVYPSGFMWSRAGVLAG